MAPQQSHYSLRWKNHQSHILSEFDALLQAETLVDVTLVCSEISVRAHKVVLSACSPFFQKIFAENPCKHPVIVLKDFQGWIIQAIVDFMYKGEISVGHEQLPFLIKAADNLQIRGLSLNENDYVCRKKVSSFNQRELNDLTSNVDDGNNDDGDVEENEEVNQLLLSNDCSFMDSFTNRAKFSPSLHLPRRKQTKPRRRSAEQNVQDLTLGKEKTVHDQPENLSMKKELPISTDEVQKSSKPQTPESLVSTEIESNVTSDKFDLLSPPQSNLQNSHSIISNHLSIDFNGYKSPLPFTQLPSTTSSLSLPSPTYFGLDAAMNLYTPPIIDNYRSNVFDLPELKSTVDQTPLYMKKKIGRPKGQHSAPRGGPPRSWTNAELTQALQHVWNRKLTTSQASRLFGIPYNSLLMYVRGKYGKSLKLEQLRNNCMGAQNTNSSDILSTLNNNNSLTSNNNNNNISNNNNNNNNSNNNNNGTILKPEKQFDSIVQSTRTPSITEDIHNSIFNPFMTNIFSDFTNSNYPMSLNMLNYLPPKTEKTSEFNFNLNLNDNLTANNGSLILPHENNNTTNSNKSVIKEEIFTSSV